MAPVLPFASVDIVTTSITGAVAIAGIVATFLAGYYGDRRKSEEERGRWLRDRRADVYLGLLDAFYASRAIVAERLGFEREFDWLLVEVDAAMAEVEAGPSPARLEEINAKTAERRVRIDELQTRIDAVGERQEAYEAEIARVFTPLQFYGSDRVRRFSPAVKDNLPGLLAASDEGGSPDERDLVERWEELVTAMREELGITN